MPIVPSAFPVPGDEVRAAATDDDRSTLREEGEVHRTRVQQQQTRRHVAMCA